MSKIFLGRRPSCRPTQSRHWKKMYTGIHTTNIKIKMGVFTTLAMGCIGLIMAWEITDVWVVGLNKRQILVISTVSTVIGVFSIVALVLRIRSAYTGWAKEPGHKITAIILSNLNRFSLSSFLAVWWPGAQSAQDNHLLAFNYVKYSPISIFFHWQRLDNKRFLMWLLTTPPHLKYVATLPCIYR